MSYEDILYEGYGPRGVAVIFAPELSRLPQSAFDTRTLGIAKLCRQFIAEFRARGVGPRW